ncbi:MAG: hypothetical protein ACI8RZ_001894 [Myxococcota bacterium]|jgi:hypothetical protein
MLILLIACTPDPVDTADTGEAEAPAAMNIEPVWSAEEMSGELAVFLEAGIPGPREMQGVFEVIFAEGDEFCPGSENSLKSAKLGCESESGWWYSGIGGYWHTAKTDDFSSFETIVQFGDMEILGPEGQRLAVGGHWIHDLRHFDKHSEWFGEINGSWNSVDFGVDWLDAGTSAWLEYIGIRFGDDELLGYGGLRGGLSIGDQAVHFDTFELSAEGCSEIAPTGTISMLDPSGGWYRLTYAGDCTSCGQLTFSDVVVEEGFCIDVSALRQSMSDELSR